MKLFKILHKITGNVLFEMECESLKVCVEAAVSKCADLRRVNLRGADLPGANLYGANLQGADLYGADLQGANLYGADLRGADLCEANLQGADLHGANLREADLRGANLCEANLQGADLQGADLQRANLCEANLQRADLPGADLSPYQICPEEGTFIAWKRGRGGEIIKLEIPAEAKRTSTISHRKCRAEFAKVLEITKDGENLQECKNWNANYPLTYKVGEIVRPDKYDPDPRIDCTHGIHFFISKQEAEDWN